MTSPRDLTATALSRFLCCSPRAKLFVPGANADEFVQRARELEWDVTLERIEDPASPTTILSSR